jgi:PAS domain S-box-containing protein
MNDWGVSRVEGGSERARLLHFTTILLGASAFFAIVELGLAVLNDSRRMLATALVMALLSCVILLARRWIARDRELAAVRGIAATLLVVPLVCEPLVPFVTPTLSLGPIIVFALALPWLSGRALARTAALCLVAEGVLAWLSYHLPTDPVTTWQRVLAATSLVAGLGLVLTLLVQHGQQQRQNIGELRGAHDALRSSQDLYRQMVEAASEGIWRGDAAAQTFFVNHRMAALLACSPADMIGRPAQAFVMPESWPTVEALLRKHAQGVSEGQELSLKHKDGAAVRVSVSAVPVHDGGGRYGGFLWLVTDVSELKTLQSQLTFADRMASIGAMAAGVAHDFNNVLTVIMVQAKLLRDSGAHASDPIERISQAANRAAELTSQLLAFGSQQVLHPEVWVLNEMARGFEDLAQSLLGENITLAFALEPEATAVRADRGQLERVFVNLLFNAKDAMRDGGRLEVGTKIVALDEQTRPDGSLVPPGTYVALSVTDTGSGMDETVRARLFEPFFTTKPLGAGTGLGLSIAFGIVKQSGGHISVTSTPGVGSTFTVYLPRALAEPLRAPTTVVATPKRASSATLLLVEDNADLRELTEEVLVREGYRVLSARSAKRAIEIYEAHPGAIDLLLTDVVMPQMGGAELKKKLRERRPDLLVLYMSGHPLSALGELETDVAAGAFLQKPFSVDSLLQKVRSALASRAPA